MLKILLGIFFSLQTGAWAQQETALTIDEYDISRSRASLIVLDTSLVPLGTRFRIHGKSGTCEIKITERVNDRLIGITEGCDTQTIQPGMKLAYSPQQNWEPSPMPVQESRQSFDPNNLLAEIKDRTTVFLGHNFSSQLEGNVLANGAIKDLDGDTAFSLGIKGRVYDFTPRVALGVELGYETPRTFDQATYASNGEERVQGTDGFSPRLSLWSLSAQAELRLMERLNGFAGLNFSIPSVRNSGFSMSGDIGFQGGATYQLYPQIGVEGLIKITNLNLKNNLGETTDVSLAGLELRGRYSF